MNKELLLIVDSVANEKAVPRDAIFQALEIALAGAARRQINPEAQVRVAINASGDIEAFRQWEIIADDGEMESPERQLRLMDALDEDGQAEVGGVIEHEIEPPKLTRVAAQTVNQILVQRVRESERQIARDDWRDRLGEMVLAPVKRFDRGQIILDIQGVEAAISREHLIPGEKLKVGERVRAVIVALNEEAKGAPLLASRTDPALMIELFAMECAEVHSGQVEIKACARDAGSRAKLAVYTRDRKIDPIGACIGMRGSRVQAVSNELHGERVDIILWSEDKAEFVLNAMAPAKVERMVVLEDEQRMDIAVEADNVGLAVGRGGQNVRLASQLTGWKLQVMSVEDFEAKEEAERGGVIEKLKDALEIDDDIAGLLWENGFATVDDIAYAPEAELLVIDGFDEDIVSELRARANDFLLTAELVAAEGELSQDLAHLPGMDGAWLDAMEARGIHTRLDLADLATDELEGIEGLSEATAGALIMEARKAWDKAA